MSDVSLPKSTIIPGAEAFAFGSGNSAILFIHGWSSSPRDLKFLAEKLSPSFYCKGVRLNGHGEDTYTAMSSYTWNDYYTTVSNAYDSLKKEYSTISVIGLSFGGALALQLAKERTIKNLILIAPFIRTPKIPIPFICIRDLVRIFPPFNFVFTKNKHSAISNPVARQEHITYQKMHIHALKELFKGVKVFSSDLNAITCPTLLLHSTKDKTSSFSNSYFILKHLSSLDKQLNAFTNSNHIITLDYEREAVEKAILSWFSTH
ncbi:MAG: alpha/beta fold hydrolase [Fibrobacterales bacterium]